MVSIHNDQLYALTGASSGIGLGTALYLAERGANLSLADINGTALQKTRAEIASRSPSTDVFIRVLDVRDAAAVRSWVVDTVAHFGRPLDGCANIAGVIGKDINLADISQVNPDDWDFVIGVNLRGVMNCLQAQLDTSELPGGQRQHLLRNGGAIVNAASVAGLIGFTKNAAYIASKHGVIGLTRAAAKEVGSRGVRVNAIAPGPIETPMLAQASVERPGTILPTIILPLERKGKVDEVAPLIAYLLGPESTYTTGVVIPIDGGMCC